MRLRVLRCFVSSLDGARPQLGVHLAQSEMLKLLMISLQDERHEVELAAVALLGRLAHVNPALVLPRLRRLLMETIER